MRHKEAIASYTRAIQINPQYAMAYYNRGNAHHALARHAEAVADWKEAKRFGEQINDTKVAQGSIKQLARHDKPE